MNFTLSGQRENGDVCGLAAFPRTLAEAVALADGALAGDPTLTRMAVFPLDRHPLYVATRAAPKAGPRATAAALEALLKDAPPRGSVWRHYKGGVYSVVCCSVAEADYTPLVTYRDRASGAVWTRPLGAWRETVPTPAGPVPRFAPTEDTPGDLPR